MYDHIRSFLSGRTARIKIGDLIGDWLDSDFGTSAGTRLGPLLFIMHLHDIPKCIKPKFADDVVALSISHNVSEIKSELQESTDQLVQWAENEGMEINVSKTKVMLFGDIRKNLCIKIHNTDIENITCFKYLGVVLDTMLDFEMQVDYAVGKSKRALSKMCMLIKDRQGISLKIAVDLYKSLIRPHFEYAIPVSYTHLTLPTKRIV